MTAGQSQEHCGHECVCGFTEGTKARESDIPCISIIYPIDEERDVPCPHDTRRSRPAPEQCPYWGIEHSDGMEWVCNRPAPAGDCVACTKHTIAYCIGKDEVRLVQCNTCIFDGKRECRYHGYPDEIIPQSCEYKIGKYAVIAPIEAQLHNQQHDTAIRKDERETVLGFLRDFISKNQCNGSCPFDSMNKYNCHNYETCDLCVYDHAVDSLRREEVRE